MNKTLGTFYTGGGLFDIGAEMAGYTSIWGFEHDDKIASVARQNGLPVVTFDLRKISKKVLKKYDRPSHFHASPPCPSFSNAKQGGVETPNDLILTDAVGIALEYYEPDTFTLENVPHYQSSESWQRILRTLLKLNYFVDSGNLNSADFGVPQTRNRFWVRASKGLLMSLPSPTPWVGWYEAIEDLIPSLPDAEFAPWQLARLPEEYKEFLIGQGTYSLPKDPKDPKDPADTITANSNQTGMKAFIMPGAGNTSFADAEPGKGVRFEKEPVHTVASDGGGRIPKAFVLDGQANNNGELVTVPDGDEPIFTQSASINESGGQKRVIRAFVLNGGNANARTYAPREKDQPHHTVTGSMDKTPSKASVGGRVVKMNIQALGRFQTVPDWYVGLTPKINGNGCPPLMVKKIMETL